MRGPCPVRCILRNGALTLAVQAEIRALMGDIKLARRKIDQALAVHRELGDGPRETVDLRILGRILALNGAAEEAERLLQEVILVRPVSFTATAAPKPKCGNWTTSSRISRQGPTHLFEPAIRA